jgi:hypothetical protein
MGSRRPLPNSLRSPGGDVRLDRNASKQLVEAFLDWERCLIGIQLPDL